MLRSLIYRLFDATVNFIYRCFKMPEEENSSTV